MHPSLIPDRAHVLADGLSEPVCPIFDAHMHVGVPPMVRRYVRCAQRYGVRQAVGLLHDVAPADLREAFGDFFVPCAWGTWPDGDDEYEWVAAECRRLDAMAADGVRLLKYKVTPRHRDCPLRPDEGLADDRIVEVARHAVRLRMVVIAHIAEPSDWWPGLFVPSAVGDKDSYFTQVDALLSAVPEMQYVACHFGGYPERLDYVGDMMRRHPGYHVDTSATKWVVRELCRHGDAAREFFLAWPERILFGSDLVSFFDQDDDTYHTSRLHVQRQMLEGRGRMPSMIADPNATGNDFPDGPAIYGLDLPENVLRSVYRDNVRRLLRLQP